MKKVIYVLILLLVVVSRLVLVNREIKNETSKKSTPKPLSAAEMKAKLKKWEATCKFCQHATEFTVKRKRTILLVSGIYNDNNVYSSSADR